jgi:nicotinamide-nucleotide amidase
VVAVSFAWLEERFRKFGRKMAENNRRQANIIDGALILPNERGTAPGQWIEHDGRVVMLLPGPPHEMKGLFGEQCLGRLRALMPPMVIRTRFLRVVGMGESDVDHLIAPVYKKYENPVTTILAGPGDIQIHLRARCPTEQEAETLLAVVGNPIEELLGDRIYSRNGDTLEMTVGKLMGLRQVTVSVAESCTGGALAERITSAPGSSSYFVGGFLTYSYEMKQKLLGVDPELLAKHKAVSEPVARAMALGAKQRTGSNMALSVTGVAGPDPGGETEPVGTVFIGLADEAGCTVRRVQFPGDRRRVRTFATQTALDMLRRKLM